eukprot:gene15033-biopygen666
MEFNEVAADQQGAECRGWPRREDEDEGDVEQDEVAEVDEDCESRFESVELNARREPGTAEDCSELKHAASSCYELYSAGFCKLP